MRNDAPQLSVAICTHNRAALLAEALQALTEQTAGPDTVEVIVVDNASTDCTAEVTGRFASRFPFFQHAHEPLPGVSHARNRALRVASADWVCFLDDDALADPDYVATALAVCREAPFACFGGTVRPWKRDPLPAWFLDEYEYGPLQDTRHVSPVPAGSFVFGTNMVVRKGAALELGGFDPAFGACGTAVVFGEETDLQARMRAAGHEIGYVPGLGVRHHARPDKYTVPRQLAIRFQAGIAWQTICHDASGLTLCAILLKLLASPAKGACRSARRLAGGGYRWQNALIETGGRLLFCLGRLAAWRAMRRGTISRQVPPCPR